VSAARVDLGRLYVITDRRACAAGRDLVEVVEAALAGVAPGGALVQLREKDLGTRDLLALARRLRAVTAPRRCPLLVNDRIDIALVAGADGVHLPERSFDVATARALGGDHFIVGVSTHSADAARDAARAGADLVVCGPVWSTPSKPGAATLGADGLARVAEAVAATGTSCRLFALGGVDSPERAREAVTRGAWGAAGIRAFIAADDPRAATSAFARATARP